MISFVWSSDFPLGAGLGGSENYTIGHIRELQKRGIDTQVVTLGLGEHDGREEFPDIPFVAAPSLDFISKLDGIIIFVSEPLPITTKNESFVILHCPPFRAIRGKARSFYLQGTAGKRLITPSAFAAALWAKFLQRHPKSIDVVRPFADACFSEFPAAKRPPKDSPVRVLFAGRLTPDKGIYTLFEALHTDTLHSDENFVFTATTSGRHTPEGTLIERFLRLHPRFNVIAARRKAEDMAALLAQHDVLVMPSHSKLWPEPFGILSVEAQHMGCRVVASNLGGLPETDCGGLHLVEPDNPLELARGIRRAGLLGRLNPLERRQARQKFTVMESVDALLAVLSRQPVHLL